MRKLDVNLLKSIREKTGAPIMRVKKVLEEAGGNEKKTVEILKKEGFEKMAKRAERSTGQGVVATYVHHSNKIAAMVELMSETDFVSRNELFTELAHSLAMQVASMGAIDAKELENQEFIKDPSKKILHLVDEVKIKTGENIRIGRIYRLELGKN